jgi:acetolactate synthase I/II/III large subunit
MCAMADGYSRATGEVTATSGTEGPGFHAHDHEHRGGERGAHAAAGAREQHAASRATIANSSSRPATSSRRPKASRSTANASSIRIARARIRRVRVPPSQVGRAGPGAPRFPGGSRARHAFGPVRAHGLLRQDQVPHRIAGHALAKDVQKAVDMINKAERPMLVAGQGVFQRKAWDALSVPPKRHDLVVVPSGPTRGHVPRRPPAFARACRRTRCMSADLVIFVGQYCDAEPRRVPVQSRREGDSRASGAGRPRPELADRPGDRQRREALSSKRSPTCCPNKRAAWVDEVAAARKAFEEQLDECTSSGLKYSNDTKAPAPGRDRERNARLPVQGRYRPERDADRFAAAGRADCTRAAGCARTVRASASCRRISTARSVPTWR